MENAKITFLGTGGGRYVMINQARSTGGWVLEMDGEMLHIDPGPGALVRAGQYKTDLEKLTGVLCSHAHPDHYTDVEVMIEAMTSGATEKKGVLVAGKNVIRGGRGFRPAVSPYHLRVLEKAVVLKPGENTRIGKIEVTATPTRHREPGGIGFMFRGSRTIGYTSDGEYYQGMENHFKHCDCIVMNILRPRGENWPEHMNTENAAKLLARAKPDMAVIQHFGMLMLRAGPEKEAAWLEKVSGVKTVAARDGMVLEVEKRGWKTP